MKRYLTSIAALSFLAGSPAGKAGTAVEAGLVPVPAGEVEAIWLAPMSRTNGPTQAVPMIRVESFKAMPYAVTRRQFEEFIAREPKWAKENVSPLFADERYLVSLGATGATGATGGNEPVTGVSWYAARAYCRAAGMRLPTVNEWEYMAAASEKHANANRDPEFLARILEWYGEPQGAALKAVGSIYRNMYGLWDMHGLIWEWVEDFNSSFVTGESREDSSFNKDMFCGAGSMSSADKENYAAFMRFAFRSGLKGRSAVWNLGFRCVQ